MSHVRGNLSWAVNHPGEIFTAQGLLLPCYFQEQFESHVVDHFSYEESNTLSNFDTVPDAFWPSALQDQSLLWEQV